MNNFRQELLNFNKNSYEEEKGLIRFALLLLALFVFFVTIFTYCIICVQVIGSSMENTLSNGDYLYVNLLGKANYGDVIIIDNKKQLSNGSYEYIVKRVIGLEGDEILIKNGDVYRNGQLLEEDYIRKIDGQKVKTSANKHDLNDFSSEKKWIVGKDEIFFLGDNRINSNDSRYYETCKESDVVGVIEKWSIKSKAFSTSFNKTLNKIRLALTGEK